MSGAYRMPRHAPKAGRRQVSVANIPPTVARCSSTPCDRTFAANQYAALTITTEGRLCLCGSAVSLIPQPTNTQESSDAPF